MFNYRTLIPSVRRLINDNEKTQVDSIDSTANATYFIVANQDAYITPAASGIIVDNVAVPSGTYTVTKNVIRCNTMINAGSAIVVQYTYVTYTDDMIAEYIGDTIHNVIEPYLNTDFEFEDTEETEQNIESDIKSLFVYGTAIQILGESVVEGGSDAIYIKDGDTVIDTSKSSGEKVKSYAIIDKRWRDLLQTVRTNRFHGVVMY